MTPLLHYFILLPLVAFLIGLIIPGSKEKHIAFSTIFFSSAHLLLLLTFMSLWVYNSFPIVDEKSLVFIKADDIEIFLDFYFDRITCVFALIGSILMLLVSIFSRFYLHREQGYKRFFSMIQLFFLGYNLIIFSGNYETLFIGWEFIGIASFLLISFYRDRYLPVRNSIKVISIYRLGDIALILAMWMSHHIWHENIVFAKFNDPSLLSSHLSEHYPSALFIMFMVVLAAMIKSGQFPFSSWLPRAMEGPTTSSGLFYGALSSHIGVFLLLRTAKYWETMPEIKFTLIVVGILTIIVAASITQVQSTIKSQIAYSSITQMGIIFLEIALGWHALALLHFAGNALLRTYQLLVSPAVLNYLVHDQFYNYDPSEPVKTNLGFKKLRSTLYVLGIKEWNLDFFQYRYLWSPFKWIGKKSGFLGNRKALPFVLAIFLCGIGIHFFRDEWPPIIPVFAAPVIALTGFLLILSSFSNSGNAISAWVHVVMGQLFVLLSVMLSNTDFGYHFILLWGSGVFIASIAGFWCLWLIQKIDNDILLNRYHGYVYERPVIAVVFLLSCLAFAGFPITPTFVGVDLLFSHVDKQHIGLIVVVSLAFLFTELALLRIYIRIFLGQHKKMTHAIAYKSS